VADGRQWVHALSWAPDDTRLALSAGKVARIFSSELEPLFAHELDYPSDVDWSPDGRLFAAGDWGAGVVLPWPPP
jgi:hypothetical protein